METEKTLMLSTEKARELYKNGSEDMKSLLLETFTKEELEQQELPKTWEEYCESHYRRGYYLDRSSCISSFTESYYDIKLKPDIDKNTCESLKNAKAILALCQLIRLRDEYNGHKPINHEEHPYAIAYDGNDNRYTVGLAYGYSHNYNNRLFIFHNEELAQEFIKNFKSLLDQFCKIMY